MPAIIFCEYADETLSATASGITGTGTNPPGAVIYVAWKLEGSELCCLTPPNNPFSVKFLESKAP